MKHRLILTLFLPVFIISCKKKEQSEPSTASNTQVTHITPSTAGTWYAFFNVDKFIEIGGYTPGIYSTAQANFFKTPQLVPGAEAAMVDSVSLNGTPMQFWPFQDSSYIDTTGLMQGMYHVISYPYTFRVSGKGMIPSFTYTRSGPFPTYTGYSALPDTLFRNAGFVLNMQTMANADEIDVTINAGPGKTVYKTVYPPFPTKLIFSPSDLSQLDTTSFSTIEIVLFKIDNLNVNGRAMLFGDGLNVTKHIVVR